MITAKPSAGAVLIELHWPRAPPYFISRKWKQLFFFFLCTSITVHCNLCVNATCALALSHLSYFLSSCQLPHIPAFSEFFLSGCRCFTLSELQFLQGLYAISTRPKHICALYREMQSYLVIGTDKVINKRLCSTSVECAGGPLNWTFCANQGSTSLPVQQK